MSSASTSVSVAFPGTPAGRRGRTHRLIGMSAVGVALVTATLPAAGRPEHAVAAAARPRSGRAAVYRNPVFTQDFPDPNVLKVGPDYYAYATITPWEPFGALFPILHSRDLTHWDYVWDAMPRPPAWSTGDWWAPSAIQRGRTFYLYYVGRSRDEGVHCVAVATAKKPTGPFVHRAIIGCGDANGRGYIDPAPFVDENGKAYLYVSVDDPYHSISVIPLRPDLLHAAGPRKELITVSQPWEYGARSSTVEGPFVIKHGRTYDLFYSGNDWQSGDYAMGYATAATPLGPFTKSNANPILRRTGGVVGPGGGSVVRGPSGGWWLAYHAWMGGPGYAAGGIRTLRIDPLEWTRRGITVRGPTTAVEPAPP